MPTTSTSFGSGATNGTFVAANLTERVFDFSLLSRPIRKPGLTETEATWWLKGICGPFFANLWVARDKFLKLVNLNPFNDLSGPEPAPVPGSPGSSGFAGVAAPEP
jgi:hypothetical protein